MDDLGKLAVLKTGPGSSIQDLGRRGWTQFGVPLSGPMDALSADWVNHLLRNPVSSALMEISQPGMQLQFDAPAEIAFSGAMASIHLDGQLIHPFQRIQIQAHSLLEIGAFDQGSRLYLGIKHGFANEEILGSRSFYKGITPKTFLQKGDQIPFYPTEIPEKISLSNPKWDCSWYQSEQLEFYPGPDYKLLSGENREYLLSETFTISQLSSRMGTILQEIITNSLPEMPTNPVYPGTVQLTSGGKLILLGRDAQVTGGYPRIMILTNLAQSILAQKKPGQAVRFSKVSF